MSTLGCFILITNESNDENDRNWTFLLVDLITSKFTYISASFALQDFDK